MAIEIKHPFVSVKGDGGDATLVRPSNWNAAHSTSMATSKLIGRLTAGAGAFEEIDLSAYMASLLAAVDKDALAALLGIFETGDVKYTFRTAAAAGWVFVSIGGSIGNAASTATILASATAQSLFVLVYDACSDAIAPVSGGRTGVAINDFNAGKRLTIPQLVGRAPIGAGSAATGTSARVLGTVVGAETHALVTAELAVHSHANSLSDPTHFHTQFIAGGASVGGGGAFGFDSNAALTTNTYGKATGITISNANAGSGTAHNNIQPSIPLNVMVKL